MGQNIPYADFARIVGEINCEKMRTIDERSEKKETKKEKKKREKREKYERKYQNIIAHSRLCRELTALNERTGFKTSGMKDKYVWYEEVNTTVKFGCFDFDRCLYEIARENDFFDFLVEGIKENRLKYPNYKKSLDSIFEKRATKEDAAAINVRYGKYRKVEKYFWNAHIINPVTSSEIHISVGYLSPMGRNYCKKSKIYTYDMILKIYAYWKEEKIRKESEDYRRSVERAKLTLSLRYDVLKRDNFRCVLCGRSSANSGVELEVDHIIPVSKGGETEMYNLRTLCRDCNRGKSDKIEDESSTNI